MRSHLAYLSPEARTFLHLIATSARHGKVSGLTFSSSDPDFLGPISELADGGYLLAGSPDERGYVTVVLTGRGLAAAQPDRRVTA